MNAREILSRLEGLGVEVWFEGARLRFRAPKGAIDGGLRAAMAENRDALVELLRERAMASETVIPATTGQHTHWFNHQADPESAAFNVSFSARVHSPVDVAAMRGALQALSDRHAALRSTFGWTDEGQFVQKVAGWTPVAFDQVDASAMDEAELLAAVKLAALSPVDLEHGPTFRAHLFTKAADDHVLVLSTHHIVVDGPSLFKAVAELRALYGEAVGREKSSLPRPKSEPGDFARWHEQLLAGPEGARMEAYWAGALANPGRRLVLPADHERDEGTAQAALADVRLDDKLLASVKRAAAARGVTPFVVFLAAYQAMLHRWTGADDVIVASPASYGRARPEFADTVGDFVNTLPLRARIRPSNTLGELADKARETLHAAIQAQDLPFARIVEIAQPGGVAGRAPLAETMFNLLRFDEFRDLKAAMMPVEDGSRTDFAGLQLSHYPIGRLSGTFDLLLQIVDLGEAVYAYWGYDPARFEVSTIELLSRDYIAALEAISTDMERTVDSLPCSRVNPVEVGAGLLEKLAARDIQCALEGGKLKISAPKGALDDALKAELTAKRDAVVAALEAQASNAASAPPIAPDRPLELSFAQRRLWFMDQMTPGSAQYNIGGALRLRGDLDTETLRAAMQDAFARHEALRTLIRTVDGEPVVEILEETRAGVEIVDASDTPPEQRDAATKAVADEVLSQPFSLSEGRMAGAKIVRFAPDDHVMALGIHHIISDGWSLAVIMRDICEFYDARVENRAPDLPELTLRYVDIAAWEHDRAASRGFAEATEYWRSALSGAPPLLDLPLDRPRPPEGATRGKTMMRRIDAALIEALDKTARKYGATRFMALLALWQVLLSRLSGQDDVVVGTPVSNREGGGAIDNVVGLLVNNVPLRADLSGAPSFAQLFEQTQGAVLAAFEHADLPFEALVEAVNPERSMAHAPIFQTSLALMSYPIDPRAPGGVQSDAIPTETGAARFDLAADLVELPFGADNGALRAAYEYAADLFDESTIARWHEHFVRLIEAAVATPEASITSVPLMTEEEAARFDVACNATAVEHDRALAASDLLARAAVRWPNEVAVVAPDRTLTYAQFDAASNKLAHVLVERGVRPGDRVAVCLDRVADLPVALSAVWRAGAAYVPLDPAHPAARLGYVLEDAEVACAVTSSAFASIFEGQEAPMVLTDGDAEAIAAASAEPLSCGAGPEDVAYVIYTSGSTGKPKGVEVEQRNLTAFLEAFRRTPGVAPGERLLAVTTPSFDIAGLELWLPLTSGATTVIASREDTLDGVRLAQLLEEHAVTVMQATPASWRLMLDAGWTGKTDLVALCGGEAMPQDLAEALLPRLKALWNVYGPTETTIWSTIHRVTAAEARISIGRPIANTRIYVLDSAGNPCPPGATGELVIAGEGVARGYRNRPDLNAEKFIEIALFGRTERAYRTGDLARWRADGALDFLGRGDGQVKIRGFRIELGEIEARLAARPEVAAAVVAAREDEPGDKRLVAYVVLAEGATLDETRLRDALRETLPDYMTPSAFVQLKRLPLSPNGKVDRKALPAPARTAAVAPPDADEALMTPAQRSVAAQWRKLLRIDAVGLRQNFFDLGGNSLLLARLQAALKVEFERDIAIVELFQHTTVAAQAERLSTSGRSGDTLKRARSRVARRMQA